MPENHSGIISETLTSTQKFKLGVEVRTHGYEELQDPERLPYINMGLQLDSLKPTLAVERHARPPPKHRGPHWIVIGQPDHGSRDDGEAVQWLDGAVKDSELPLMHAGEYLVQLVTQCEGVWQFHLHTCSLGLLLTSPVLVELLNEPAIQPMVIHAVKKRGGSIIVTAWNSEIGYTRQVDEYLLAGCPTSKADMHGRVKKCVDVNKLVVIYLKVKNDRVVVARK